MWPASTSTSGASRSIARIRARRLRSTTRALACGSTPPHTPLPAPNGTRGTPRSPGPANELGELRGGGRPHDRLRAVLGGPAGADRQVMARPEIARVRDAVGVVGARLESGQGASQLAQDGHARHDTGDTAQTLAGTAGGGETRRPAHGRTRTDQCSHMRSSFASRSSRLAGLSRCSTPAGARSAESTRT